MSLNKILKQPFPYDPCARDRVGMAAFFGSFIFGFLMIFQPFELDQFTSQRLLIIALAYGLITFSCVLAATTVLPFFFPEIFNESAWTTGKQILFTAGVIFFVGLINYLISPLLVDTRLDFYNAIWFQGITLSIGLLPVSLFILLKQNRLLKKFSRQAEQIEQKLHEKQEVNESIDSKLNNILSNKISLIGEYQNEIVEIYPDDLYVVTSASNYIKIFHLQKEKLVYSIIRSTLKKAEEIILEHPNFFKCHRAFIINLDKVVHVEGNAQGYKVRIDNHDELIPVSRNLNSEFSDKLLAFRKEKF
ncbi:MAG: LytR/AlgR family response regulator transcription factor [Chitinophagaceae bacterium]